MSETTHGWSVDCGGGVSDLAVSPTGETMDIDGVIERLAASEQARSELEAERDDWEERAANEVRRQIRAAEAARSDAELRAALAGEMREWFTNHGELYWTGRDGDEVLLEDEGIEDWLARYDSLTKQEGD